MKKGIATLTRNERIIDRKIGTAKEMRDFAKVKAIPGDKIKIYRELEDGVYDVTPCKVITAY